MLGEAVGPRAGGMTLPWFPAVSSHPLSARSVLSLERKVGRAEVFPVFRGTVMKLFSPWTTLYSQMLLGNLKSCVYVGCI